MHLTKTSFIEYGLLRFFRIWPPYALLWLLLALISNLMSPSATPLVWREVFLFSVGKSPVLMPQAWTLSIEILFSLTIPFLIYLRMQYKRDFGLFLLIIGLFSTGIFQYVFHFAAGYLVYRLNASPNKFQKLLCLTFGVLFYTLNLTLPEDYQLSSKAAYLSTGIGAILIIILINSFLSMQRILRPKLLIYIGKISFSIYLTHYFIILAIVRYATGPLTFIDLPYVLSWCIGLLLSIALTLLVSIIFHHLIEMPMLAWLKVQLLQLKIRS